ncbi:MAG TPA: hypothetical protein VFJ16_03275 [Longimicrobium sp.]|nr:hypothetical protein [Longimicrobium sp.]
MERRIGGWVGGTADGTADRRMERGIGGWNSGSADGTADRRMERRIGGSADRIGEGDGVDDRTGVSADPAGFPDDAASAAKAVDRRIIIDRVQFNALTH